MNKKVDVLDLKILSMLLKNKSTSFISKKLGFSGPALYYRIKKLRKTGVLKGSSPLLDLSLLGYNIVALINIKAKKGKVIESSYPWINHKNVCSIYGVTGDFDVVLLAKFKSINDLNLLVKEIMSSKLVERTNTTIVLDNIKESLVPSEISF